MNVRETVAARLGMPAPMRDVLARAAEASGVSIEDIAGPRRTRDLCWVRFAAIWAMKRLRLGSYPAIGRALGGRDHSTIAYALREARTLRETDDVFRAFSDRLAAPLPGMARAEDFGIDPDAFHSAEAPSGRGIGADDG